MAPKKQKTDEGGDSAEQLKSIYQVLKLEVDEETFAAMEPEDIAKEIERLEPIAVMVAEQSAALKRNQEIMATVIASNSAAAPMKSKEGASVHIPEYKPVKRLTIRKLRGGSGVTQILSKYVDRDNRPTQMRLVIKFPDDLKLIWDSEKHTGEIPPTVINFYGGNENVLGIIKARIEEIEKRSPGEYEIIDTNKMDLILAEEDIQKYSEDEIKKAIEDPNSPEAKSLFDFFKARRGAANVPVSATVVR